MKLKNKTCLVLGGAGFIGSHLAESLAIYGAKVTIIDNLCQSNEGNVCGLKNVYGVELVRIDIRDYDSIEKYIFDSDFVFHLAASDVGSSEIQPKINIETNILGTFNILEAIKKKPEGKLINVSSGSVVNPSTVYAISKLAAENLVTFYAKEKGVKALSVRPHHVFGPRQRMDGTSGVINIFAKRIIEGKPPIVWGDGKQIKCFTYVQDVVNAIIIAAEKGDFSGEYYDVSSKVRMSINELANLMVDKYAENKEIEFTTPKTGENMILNPDTTKIEKLGFKINHDFKSSLEFTFGWVLNNK